MTTTTQHACKHDEKTKKGKHIENCPATSMALAVSTDSSY